MAGYDWQAALQSEQTQLPQPGTIGDVGVNLLSAYLKNSHDKKKREQFSNDLSEILKAGSDEERTAAIANSSNPDLKALAVTALLKGGDASGRALSSGIVVEEDGEQVFKIPYQNPDGSLATQTLPLGGKKVGASGETAEDKRKRDLEAKQQELAGKLKTESEFAATEKAKQNEGKLQIWEGIKGNISQAFEGATTGPGMGALPAVTASQQMAEASIKTAVPAMKEFFRGPAEGTFTDRDQQVLIDMLPTRNDLPETRNFKLQLVDEIVRGKLGFGGTKGTEDAEAAIWAMDKANYDTPQAKQIRKMQGLE